MAANLFTIPSNDQSLYFLGQIFGNVGGVLATSDGTPNIFTGALFSTLNTIALAVGAIIVVYVTIVGVMATAQEGEFLGKKWGGGSGSLWVPIRMVMGVGFLFPAVSGYSALQVIIMWIIVQGVGAADTLWQTAIKFNKSSAAYASAAGANTMGTKLQMQLLYQSLVCEETIIANRPFNFPFVPQPREIIPYYGSFSPSEFNVNSSTYSMGPNGICGKLTKCNKSESCKQGTSSGACMVCTAQNTVLQANIKQMRTIAKRFAQSDWWYIVFYYFVGKEIKFPAISNMGTLTTKNVCLKADARDWIQTYCKNKSLEKSESGPSTCCVPPSKSNSCCAANDNDADPARIFPKPFNESDSGKAANGMSVGSGSELEQILQWSMLPFLTQKDAPVTDVEDYKAIDFVTVNAQLYSKALLDKAAEIDLSKQTVSEPDASSSNNLYRSSATLNDAINYGWITAGAFFYRIVQATKKNMQSVVLPLSVSQPDKSIATDNVYRSNYNAAGDFLSVITQGSSAQQGEAAEPVPGASSKYSSAINDVKGTLSTSWKTAMKADVSGPGSLADNSQLLKIAIFGQNLLIIAQLFYVLLIVINSILALVVGTTTVVGGVAGFVFGNVTSAAEAFKAFFNMLTPAIFILLGALMTMGALLGMYIPMIPFVVFTASVIGWFIAVIEAMVAGPIIALGILTPGGQSELFSHAEPSIKILFNLFLRPSLMVFGLLVAMFMAEIVIKFVNQGFSLIMYDVMNLEPGIVEEIIFIAIYTSIIFTSMNQVFTLIHHIPERILTYIGGQPMSYGESQAAQAAKQATEGAASGLASAEKGMVAAHKKGYKHKKKDDDDNDKTAELGG